MTRLRMRLFKQRSKDRYKRSLCVVPNCLTFFNAVCGFLSITQALDGHFVLAALCILLAALWDALDGRVARALGHTSGFGMELDSLADAISFCLAPSILLYCWFYGYVHFGGMVALALYLCAGLTRLARFNSGSAGCLEYFIGLPTPAAAFVVSFMVLLFPYPPSSLYCRISIVVLIALAYLMISNIKIPSGKK